MIPAAKNTLITKDQMIKLSNDLHLAKKKHDIDTLLSLYHPDCLIEYPTMGMKNRGRLSVRPAMALYTSIFADYTREEVDYAVNDDTLISWGTTTLTLTGNFNGFLPNGRRAMLKSFLLLKFADNMIIHECHFWDQASLCQQSGISADIVTLSKEASL
jgi:hypothetical protein